MPTKSETEASLDALRKKGVTVETPESRKVEQELLEKLSKLKVGDPSTKNVKYVFVPADDGKPLEEVIAVMPEKAYGQVDILQFILKTKFSNAAIDLESLKKSASKSLLANQQEFNGKKISLDDLSKTAALRAMTEGAVEVFKLGEEENFYLDEVGSFKKLATNKRAAFIAAQCGFGSNIPFFGDIYLGRVKFSDGKIYNVDMKLSECDVKDVSTMKGWAPRALEFNMKTQRIRQAHGMSDGMTPDEINTKGGEEDSCSWSQTTEEVEIAIKSEAAVKAKTVDVKFKSRSLLVRILGVVVLDLEMLFAEIDAFESTWSVVDGKLIITLLKSKQGQVWSTL